MVRGVTTPGTAPSRLALPMRPVFITARGSLMTGAELRATRRMAASSAGSQRSASPMALKIS
jgi:hypothetical protein